MGPSYLASVKDFGRGKVGQVLVIRKDRHTQRGALEIAPLFGEAIYNYQELFVVDFVVYLGGLKFPRVKSHGMETSVIALLGEDGTKYEVRSISLDDGGLGWVEVI